MRISFVLIHVTNQGGLSWSFRLGLILIRLRCGPGRRRPRTDRRLGVSNSIFKSCDDIVDPCREAWNKFVDQPWRIMSIGVRDWAYRFLISESWY